MLIKNLINPIIQSLKFSSTFGFREIQLFLFTVKENEEREKKHRAQYYSII